MQQASLHVSMLTVSYQETSCLSHLPINENHSNDILMISNKVKSLIFVVKIYNIYIYIYLPSNIMT